ncbi:CmcJ/NvfI family oxidoreductase [Paraburkholderia sp. BR10954]|uniref:CmcJ/NvfI family oxidoreductase n=1 Tax=Paraburkholderia sp. BR10954 TaxID=3236995 RepID=UPI0034D2EE08
MNDIVIEQPAVVEAALNYLVANGEKPATYAYEPPDGAPLRSGVYRTQRVNVSNARIAPPPGGLSLDRNGFELHHHASALNDFSDPTAFNPRHRWYYFPLMSPDEVLLLKIYDSAGDDVARLTAHTAFDDPSSPLDAQPRRSIELRALLFF